MISITINIEENGKKVSRTIGGDYHTVMNIDWSGRISDMLSDNFDDEEEEELIDDF